jgi:hypothetical protein
LIATARWPIRCLYTIGPGAKHYKLRAVIRHLGAEHAGELSQRQVAESIVTILRPAGGGEPSAATLLENPEILASFFQNADLLDPHGADSMAISRMVMKALEGVHGAG